MRRMQVIFFAPPYGAEWNSKRVVVRGTPHASENAYHHTPVMLDARKVAVAP